MERLTLKKPPTRAADWEKLSTREKVEAVSLRHDMPLKFFDVVVTFEDGSQEILPVQARDPLSAIRLSSYTPERTWPAEKLGSIASITWNVGR